MALLRLSTAVLSLVPMEESGKNRRAVLGLGPAAIRSTSRNLSQELLEMCGAKLGQQYSVC